MAVNSAVVMRLTFPRTSPRMWRVLTVCFVTAIPAVSEGTVQTVPVIAVDKCTGISTFNYTSPAVNPAQNSPLACFQQCPCSTTYVALQATACYCVTAYRASGHIEPFFHCNQTCPGNNNTRCGNTASNLYSLYRAVPNWTADVSTPYGCAIWKPQTQQFRFARCDSRFPTICLPSTSRVHCTCQEASGHVNWLDAQIQCIGEIVNSTTCTTKRPCIKGISRPSSEYWVGVIRQNSSSRDTCLQTTTSTSTTASTTAATTTNTTAITHSKSTSASSNNGSRVDDPPKGDNHLLPIIVGVVAGTLTCAGAVAAAVWFIKRSKNQRTSPEDSCLTKDDDKATILKSDEAPTDETITKENKRSDTVQTMPSVNV